MFWRRRDPFRALPGQDVFEIHGVDLLEGAALTFNDEEVDDESTQEVAASENITISIIIKLENDLIAHRWKIRTYLKSMAPVMKGVKKPIQKFQIQLLAVDRAIPFAR